MKALKLIVAIGMAFALITSVGCASTSKKEGTGEYMDSGLVYDSTIGISRLS